VNRLVLNWVAIVLAVVLATQLLPGKIGYSSLEGLAIFAVVLGLLNAIVAPIVRVLTFPLTIVTLGLFSFVVNAVMFWAATDLSRGVGVAGFEWAFVAALMVSILNAVVVNVLA